MRGGLTVLEDSRIHYPPDDGSGDWVDDHEEDHVWDFLEEEGLIESWEDWAKEMNKDPQDPAEAVARVYQDVKLRVRFEEYMVKQYEASKEPPERLGDHE